MSTKKTKYPEKLYQKRYRERHKEREKIRKAIWFAKKQIEKGRDIDYNIKKICKLQKKLDELNKKREVVNE